MPLYNWSIITEKNKLAGLSWWQDYNKLKHQGFKNFYKATLDNAIESLAALYILELYLMKKELGKLKIATDTPCCYFTSEYISPFLSIGGKPLPDFENKNDS